MEPSASAEAESGLSAALRALGWTSADDFMYRFKVWVLPGRGHYGLVSFFWPNARDRGTTGAPIINTMHTVSRVSPLSLPPTPFYRWSFVHHRWAH